ncbi:MAG: VOC family protein [Bacteroidota bacterium]
MITLNPYINFKGCCREAMTFYKDCIGGNLFFQTVGGSPMESQCPPELKDQVLHSSLQNGELVIMGSDMSYPGFLQGNNISLSVNCSSETELDTLFASISEGGKLIHALADTFWGAKFGVLEDKFGIKWMLNYEKSSR